jgi:hypothetical protein
VRRVPAASPIAEPGHDELGPGFARLARFARALRPGSTSPRVQRALLGVALAAFAVMAAVAVRAFPDEPDPEPRWPLLLLVGIAGPLVTVLLNALEYVQQGRLVAKRIALPDALRVSVLGTAANLAPVPGSVLVRTNALVDEHTGVRAAASTTVTVGLAWLAAGALAAGVLQPFADRALAGAVLAAAGVGLFALVYVFVRRAVPAHAVSHFGAIALVELATVAVGALRLAGFIAGLGLDVTAAQAVGLTLAGVVASATGIFPAGLGIREALVAAASPLLDVPAAVGLAAAAADRLAGLAVLAVLTVVILRTRPPDAPAGAGAG